MPQNPVRWPRWFAVVVLIAAAAIAMGASSHQNRVWAAPGTDKDRADESAVSRRSASADQAGGQAELPWQFQVVDQAGGATGPVVVVGSLAYVGRGPVVAVADISDDERPRWVGQSAALEGAVTELALWQGHLLALIGHEGYEERLVSLSLDSPLSPRLVGEMPLSSESLELFTTSDQAWLGHLHLNTTTLDTTVSVMALTLDTSGKPAGQVVWQSTRSGWSLPARAPIVRTMGAGSILVLEGGSPDRDLGAALWRLTKGPDGQWLPRSRLPLRSDTRAMAVDAVRRLAYVAAGSTLAVFDVTDDGRLRPRGSTALGASSDCGGLLWSGRWLVASSGCGGGTSAALIDVSDPDLPSRAAPLAVGRSIARLAPAGDRWVATGGDSGGLTILRPEGGPSFTAHGHIQDAAVFSQVVDTAHGRFGLVAGLGIGRLTQATDADWARSELVHPLPGVTALAVGPDGLLIATEAREHPAPAQLHLFEISAAGLTPRRSIALEASWAGNLTVVGNDLYLGLAHPPQYPQPRIAPIQRWRFLPDGLALQARTDPQVGGSCYVVSDQVYVAVSNGMVALDPQSLTPLKTLGSDQPDDNTCRFAVRRAADGAPRFLKSSHRSLFVQQIDDKALKTSSQVDWPGPNRISFGEAAVRDLGSETVAFHGNGLLLVDSRSETDLRALAHLSLSGLTDITTIGPERPSFAAGRRWVVSSARLGLLLVTLQAASDAARPIGPTVPPWASPTLAPSRPQPTATTSSSLRQLYLPLTIDRKYSAWPPPFEDLRSIGPTFSAIAAVDDRAWIADGLTLALLTQDGGAPRLTERSANLPAPPRLLATGKDLLVAIAGSRELIVLKRPADAAPEALGQLELPDHVIDLTVVADHVYVATAFCGIFTVDLSLPARPRIVSILGTPRVPRRLLAADGWLLSIGMPSGSSSPIAVASLATPSRPEWVREQVARSYSSTSMATDGKRVFIVPGDAGAAAKLTAYQIAPDGVLVEDRDWSVALEAAIGSWGTVGLVGIAASRDWLLLWGEQAIVAVERSGDGLPQRIAGWVPGPKLRYSAMALTDGSAYALTWGLTAGASIGGPDTTMRGGLLWMDLPSLMATAAPALPAHAWISDFPHAAEGLLRFGGVLCIGPSAEQEERTRWWLAMNATDPQRSKPLGRMDLPAGVHGLLPTGEDTALALRWLDDQKLGSILHLDLADILHPRVLSEFSLQGRYPARAWRSGDLVAVRTTQDHRSGKMQDSYLLLHDSNAGPLTLVTSISDVGDLRDGEFFIDGDRGYLSGSGRDYRLIDGAYYPDYRTMVFDLQTRPPRHLGDLPFPALAFKRVGGDVLALVNDAARPRDSYLATVSLADPPSRSTIRQRIDLAGSVPMPGQSGAIIGNLTALPDGSLLLPAMAGDQAETGQPNFMVIPLRAKGPQGSWIAGPGLPLDLAGLQSPSLTVVNGWLAFLGVDVANSERVLLHLARLAP